MFSFGFPFYSYGYPYYYGGYPYSYGYPYYSSYSYYGDPYYGSYGYDYSPYESGYGYSYNQPRYRDNAYGGGGSKVAQVQRGLAREGYYQGSVDGIMGPRTHYAIRAYQRAHGLEVDGEIGDQLLSTMRLR